MARVARAGADVTLVAWGWALDAALAAAELVGARGISAEVLDLRTLAPWDADGVAASVARTGRLVVAEADVRAHGFGAEVVAATSARCFGALSAAPVRLGGAPDAAAIAAALGRAVGYP